VLPSNLQTNLTGFYPFCGNANDESSFSNNGSVNGAVLSNDRFNNSNSAYDFDGSNDYIDLGSPSANSGSLTISSWVKTTNVVNGQRWIVSRSSWTTGAWQLMTYNGYAASEFDWGGQLVGNTFIADGQWHHILTIYDASTNYRYLYVDGVQDGIDMTRGCDSYDWDGVTYTSTGQYTNLYTNINGCDSTVTLDLTINNSSTNTVTLLLVIVMIGMV
jgi:hypothetical protein